MSFTRVIAGLIVSLVLAGSVHGSPVMATTATDDKVGNLSAKAPVKIVIIKNFTCKNVPDKYMKGVVSYDGLVFKRWFIPGNAACWTVKAAGKGVIADWDVESFREKADGTRLKSKTAHFDDIKKVGGIVQFPEGGTGHVFVWCLPNGEVDQHFIAINLGAPMPSTA